ncbi:MAG TPA: ABC transporter permease [Pyrinomonadaceae bacterium]|nr:ABC transporter permease [Pyrinomonadaceae bacterium]
MRALLQDLRYGVRVLLKSRGFALVAVITLALGIGASTAAFSVVHAVLLRPLPFPEQERLVVAWKRDATTNNPFVELSVPDFRDWQAQSRSFESLAVMPTTVYGHGYVLTGRGEPVQLESAKVTGRYFEVLGARAALGRVFDESDDRVGGPPVVVLSDRLWRERFGADPGVVGQAVTLNQTAFNVIGVMPPAFNFPAGVDLWVPLLASANPRGLENRYVVYLQAVGRLKEGVTQAQAEADLNTIIARLAAQYPETEAAGQRVVLTPLADYLFGDAKPALWALFAATALLLLVGAANIANLMLARATSRRRELAVRVALGASRGRLALQLLAESLVLALAGGAAGLLLASWLVELLTALAPSDIPRLEDVTLSGAALLASVAFTLVTTAVFGLLPALSASRFNLGETLSEAGGKLTNARTGNRLRGALVVGEVALTLVLVAGATLILRSFLNLSSVPLGFDPRGVLTTQLRLTGSRYGKPEARREFFSQLIERLEARPGVVAASGVLTRPLEGVVAWDYKFAAEGQPADAARQNPDANFEIVNPHYFRTFAIPLKAGREFDERDRADAEPVVVVSQSLAERYFGSAAGAVGRRLMLDGDEDEPWRTIVGVAGDVRYRELQAARLDIYVPHMQGTAYLNHFAVRSNLSASDALALVRKEVAALDPEMAVSRVVTMEQQVALRLARPRFTAVLLNWLALMALLLAAVGIFGVTAYAVAQRTRELGLRVALGARPRDILMLVVWHGLRLAALGILPGLLGALLMTRWLSSLLYGVTATDPLTYAGVALLTACVALLACLIPARRATKVDPMVALRYE